MGVRVLGRVGGGGNWMERQLSGRPSVHITQVGVSKLCMY